MRIDESRSAAKSVLREFDGLAETEAQERALLADEGFYATAYLHEQAYLYAEGTQHNQEAVDALKRALREHAQRVRGEMEAEA